MEILAGLTLWTSAALSESRPVLGLVAALLLALVTAFMSWHVTDRLVALWSDVPARPSVELLRRTLLRRRSDPPA
ncbi:hypothetical protein [Thermomonospora umbrina]|uniref:Uncharacterized protein n=1 Tax=Thermomonospora umbrina TaxID=111806 RepID=A0A3D9SQJ7_9ACTN|nr:hypothetical protein [Thermomonospora umbrina]REE98246.1 hypothetical protein DFJ69_3730 [Thermomonospora umbrina]